MKYRIYWTSAFKKDYKRIMRRGKRWELAEAALAYLGNGLALPERYHDHALTGTYAGFREFHVQPDWLIVYTIDNGALVLTLMRTGTHSDLF